MKKISEVSGKIPRPVKFVGSGGISVLVYYMTLTTLTELVHVWYLFSAVIGAVLATGINFVIQKHIVFQNKDRLMARRQLILFVANAVAIFAANSTALYLLVEYAHIGYLWAQVPLTLFFSAVNYFLTRNIFK